MTHCQMRIKLPEKNIERKSDGRQKGEKYTCVNVASVWVAKGEEGVGEP